jgi:hypothetical protein
MEQGGGLSNKHEKGKKVDAGLKVEAERPKRATLHGPAQPQLEVMRDQDI